MNRQENTHDIILKLIHLINDEKTDVKSIEKNNTSFCDVNRNVALVGLVGGQLKSSLTCVLTLHLGGSVYTLGFSPTLQ